MSPESNKALCSLFIQTVFNEGRLTLAREFVADDVVHHDLGTDEELEQHGLMPMVETLALYRYAFPDLRVEIEDAMADGDRVITRLCLSGTQKNQLMGIAATGRRVRIQGVRIDRIEGGKIAETWLHWNTLGMLEQIGALPSLNRKPAPAPIEATPSFLQPPAFMPSDAAFEPAMWNAAQR